MFLLESTRNGFDFSQVVIRRRATKGSGRLLRLEFAVGALFALPKDKGGKNDESSGCYSDDANDGA